MSVPEQLVFVSNPFADQFEQKMYPVYLSEGVTGATIKDKINAARKDSGDAEIPNKFIVLLFMNRQLKDTDVIDQDMIRTIQHGNKVLQVRFPKTSPPTMAKRAIEARQALLMRAKYNVDDRCMVDRSKADVPIIYIPEGRISDIKINHDDKVVYIINDREVEEEYVFQFPEDIRDKSSEYYRVSVALLKQIQKNANIMVAAEAIERRERRLWPNYVPQYEARPVTPPTEAPRAESSSWNPYLSSFVDNAV